MLPDQLGRPEAEVSEDSVLSCRASWGFSGPRLSNAARYDASLGALEARLASIITSCRRPTLATEFQTAEPPENSGRFSGT
jgi:hypothetical protein